MCPEALVADPAHVFVDATVRIHVCFVSREAGEILTTVMALSVTSNTTHLKPHRANY